MTDRSLIRLFFWDVEMIGSGRGKGRKKGPPKTTGPSDAPRGIGDNQLTDDQRRGLFLQELAKLERLMSEQASAVSAVRLQRKTMKADGFDLKDEVGFALKLRNTKHEDDVSTLRKNAWAAQALAAPIGMQLGLMLDEEAVKDRTPAADRAYQLGKTAGFEGQSQSPPYDPTTEQGRRWMEGWQDAQNVILKGFKPLETVGMPSAEPVEPANDDGKVTGLRPRFLRGHKGDASTIQ